MDLEWGNATSKADIFKRLSSIEYTGGDTSAVTGIKLATQVQFYAFQEVH